MRTFPLAVQLLLKDNLTPGWARAEREMRTRGTTLLATSKKLSLYVTAPLAAVAAMAVKATTNYEGYLARIQRATGAGKGDVERFGEALQQQAIEQGYEFNSLADVAAKASGEYKRISEAQKAVTPTMQLAEVTATDTAVAFESLNGVLAAYKKSVDQAPQVADLLARTSAAAGEGSLPALAAAMNKLAPAALKRGVTLERVAAAFAKADERERNLPRLLKELESQLKKGDTSGFQTGTEILSKQRSLSEQLQNDFIAGRKAINSLRSAWDAVLVDAGKAGLYDGFTTLLKIASGALKVFRMIPEPLRQTIVLLGSAAAVLGPVGMGVGFLLKKVTFLKPAVMAAAASFSFLGGAVRAVTALVMANPIGAIVTGLAFGALLVIKNWDKVKKFLASAWDWLKDKYHGTLGWIIEKVQSIGLGLGLIRPAFAMPSGSVSSASAAVSGSSQLARIDPLTVHAAPSQAEITLNVRGLPKGTSVTQRGDAFVRTNLGETMSHVPAR